MAGKLADVHLLKMKTRVLLPLALSLATASCEKEDPPKATVVVDEQVVTSGDPVLDELEEVREEAGDPLAQPPVVVEVDEEGRLVVEEAPTRLTPGERVDRAIEVTEDRLETAGERTEKGVRTAMEGTGRLFRRLGEKLEETAEDARD